MKNITEYDLIHKGLYRINKQIAWFDAVHNRFHLYREERSLGFLTRFQRSHALACCISSQNERGFYSIYKNYHIEPVPITEKILIMNGWQLINGVYYFHKPGPAGVLCWLEWRESNKTLFINEGLVSVPVIYVHQIQQALCLCGLPDLAENFKIME